LHRSCNHFVPFADNDRVKHSVLRGLVIALALLISGCADTPVAPSGGQATSATQTSDILGALRREGATVSFAEVMPAASHPYFGVRAVRYIVNGESLQIFEHATEAAATAATGRISRDGTTIGTTHVDWISDPHFYRSGLVIALYVGRQTSTLDLLRKVLGAQVAGR
jgi:hypothetical protein